jgi:predicted ATPase/DNA-binding SARP family transcriptional activator
MSRLALYLLGPPRIALDDQPIHLDRRKAVALLAYLAVTGHEQGRDALATLLWPELDQQRARAGLRRTLVTLRNALGEGWLQSDRETVHLNPDADLWLDVAQFRQKLDQCQTHNHPPDEPCADCLSLLSEAVGLYQDDFLAGFTLRDSLAFDEWQFFETEALRQALASALTRLAQGYAARAEYDAAIPYARRWVTLDLLHEPAQRELMTLYARAGQASAALRQYQVYEDTLAEELGTSPSGKIQMLYERVRAGGEIEPALAAPSAIPNNLLPPPTPFVGRQEELAAIVQRLVDPACRLLTLAGPGGIGKTRLAIQAAQEMVASPPDPIRFSRGVFFVPLALVDSVDALIPAIAEAIGFPFHRPSDPEQQLLDYLRRKDMLLVLDNFEHLLAPPAGGKAGGATHVVTDMLAAAPQVKILITSRIALNLHEEWFYPVDGMRFPHLTQTESAELEPDLETFSAVALFVQGARRVNPRFSLAAEHRAVARICQLVEGMPLAIELAAAWLKVLSPDQIGDQIEQSLDFLETDARDVPAGKRSLHAVFDASWGLLSEGEQLALQHLSVFRGSFNYPGAQQVGAGGLKTLLALVNQGWIRRATDDRFQIHELLRQYAATQLAQQAELEATVRDRHSLYYCDWLRELEPRIKGSEQQVALDAIEIELDNVRTACHWAAANGCTERLHSAIDSLGLFHQLRLRFLSGDGVFKALAQALATAESLLSTDSASTQHIVVRLRIWQTRFSSFLGNQEQSRHLAQESLALLESPILAGRDTRSERADIELLLGYSWRYSAPEEASRHFRQSYDLFEEIGDKWSMASALTGLARAYRNIGALEEAQVAAAQSLELCREMGHHLGSSEALMLLAALAIWRAQFPEAEHLAQQSFTITPKTVPGTPWRLHVLGWVQFLLGQFDAAAASLEEAVAMSCDLGAYSEIIFPSRLLRAVYVHQGRHHAALAQIERLVALVHEGKLDGGRELQAQQLWLLGALALADGAYADAYNRLRESLDAWEHPGGAWDRTGQLACLGLAARGLGRHAQAREHLTAELRKTFSPWGIGFVPMMVALSGLALLAADEGEAERAIELYALAARHPLVSNSRWFEAVAGEQIATVAAALPPEVVVAAQERGQARDLNATVAELLGDQGFSGKEEARR